MKRLKQMLLLTMLVAFTLGIAVPVYAKTEVRTETLYPAKDTHYLGHGKNEIALKGHWEKKNPYTNVNVENKAVASVKTSKKIKGYGSMKALALELKKTGRTAISYKEKSEYEKKAKTYKIDLRVRKYVNPISSIRFGNQTIKGSKFNNTSVYKVKYSDFKNRKIQVKITPAKGWSLEKMVLTAEAKDLLKKADKAAEKGDDEKAFKLQEKAYTLPRKPSFVYFPAKVYFGAMSGYTSFTSTQNGKSIKVNGGKGSEIMITLTNNKTKQVETIEIRFQ